MCVNKFRGFIFIHIDKIFIMEQVKKKLKPHNLYITIPTIQFGYKCVLDINLIYDVTSFILLFTSITIEQYT